MIEIRELSVEVEGRLAIEGLTLAVGPGEIFGLLGPLGSGRSTLLKVLAGLIPPGRGEATVAGWSLREHPERVRAGVGYLPGFFGAYEDLRAGEYLEFYGLAYHVERARLEGRVEDLLERVGLGGRRADYIAALDAEGRQRLGLAKTLIHDPAVLLLDEPAMGLEPAARGRIRDVLAALRPLGKTVLVCSNLVLDVAGGVCDRIGVLHRGRLLVEGPAEAVLRDLAGERLIELEVRGETAAVCAAIAAHPAVHQAVAYCRNVIFSMADAEREPGRVVAELAGQGLPITAWREHEIQPEGLLERLGSKA